MFNKYQFLCFSTMECLNKGWYINTSYCDIYIVIAFIFFEKGKKSFAYF